MWKTLLGIIGLIFLTSCSTQVDRTPSPEIIEKIISEQEVYKTLDFQLTQTKISVKTFKINVLLNNPEEKELTSVRSWLSYNPNDLKIIKIDTENSDFNLSAPGEDKVDSEKGLIKIGRSNTAETVNSKEIKIANITVEKLQTGATLIDFYDYHKDQSGHTNANMLLEGKIYNLAKKTLSPALVLE